MQNPMLRFAAQEGPEAPDPAETLTRLLSELGWKNVAPWIGSLAVVVLAAILAFGIYQLARRLILRGIHRVADKTAAKWDDVLVGHRVFQRLTHLLPALVLYLAMPLAVAEGEILDLARQVTIAYMVLAGVLALSAVLSALNQIYETGFRGAGERPIRSYVQVLNIVLWVFAGILVVAVFTGRSPWGLLGGLGAMTAVLMLTFKDSILGLVASIQLTANDMVRIGDWIEMPQFGADGNVEEILLTTVKVRNWDKTITTIPSYRLISDAFKNWRGMSSSGVRRIRRSLLFDMTSVRFVDDEMLARLRRIRFLEEYLDRKLDEVRRWNVENGVDESSKVNGRRLTNFGTFRAYLEAYLKSLPFVDRSETLMVHQLSPTEKGLPLQIYVFSKEQRWAYWEALQADIFDHILAVAGEFDLRIVQIPTGADVRALVAEA